MAVIYYSGNQRTRAVEYAVTVSTISAGQTITATINSKVETYTATSNVPATEVAACVSQLSSSLLNELQNFTFSASGSVIRAVGPANGAPLTITWGGTASLTGTTPSVTALSPANIADAANYAGGSLPVNGDVLVLENGSFNLLWNLNQFQSNTITIIRRASHTGQIGLVDNNPAGYPEYLPTHLATAGTSITIEDNGASIVRVRSNAGSAVTAVITGGFQGQLGNETVELHGTPASSVININGGSLAFCPLGTQSGTAATVRVANAAFRVGGGATLGTISAQNSQVAIASTYTNYTQGTGTNTTISRAAAGTNTTINDGLMSWASTGSPGTVIVNSNATFDTTFTPSPISVTAITLNEGGTLLDPNRRLARPFDLTTVGELANMTINLGDDTNVLSVA